MKQKLNEILALAENYNENKQQIERLVGEVDAYIVGKYPKYKANEDFLASMKQEHDTLAQRLARVGKTSYLALPDIVAQAHNIMHEFVKENSLGFLSDFKLAENVFYDVEIACMLTSHSYHQTETIEQQRKRQINTLTGMGLQFIEESAFVSLIACDSNVSIIRKLLEEKGAKLFRCSFIENKIDKINFWISGEDLKNFIIEKKEIETVCENGLTAVDKQNIKFKIGDLLTAFSVYDITQSDKASFLIYNSFADISSILHVNSVCKEHVDKEESSMKKLRDEISEMKKKILEYVDISKTSDYRYNLFFEIEKQLSETLGLTVRKLSIGSMGNIEVTVKKNYSEGLSNLKFACEYETELNRFKETDFAKLYDVVNINDDNLILDTDRNRGIIERGIAEIAGMRFAIKNFSVEKESSEYTIHEITLISRPFVLNF